MPPHQPVGRCSAAPSADTPAADGAKVLPLHRGVRPLDLNKLFAESLQREPYRPSLLSRVRDAIDRDDLVAFGLGLIAGMLAVVVPSLIVAF